MSKSAQPGRNAPVGLRIRILIPLTLAILGLVIAFSITLYVQEAEEITQESTEILSTISADLASELDMEADGLGAAIEVVMKNSSLRSALASRDRKALQSQCALLFETLRKEFRITHFYFIGPDKTCLLRVHKPDLYGDRIDRFTLHQAEETRQRSHGMELGPLGTLTLRVVQPVHDDDQLIGYIELGKEIQGLVARVASTFKLELFVSIRKRFLEREGWEAGMKMLNREPDWDRFADSVIVMQTLPTTPAIVSENLRETNHHHLEASKVASVDGVEYRLAFSPLIDAGGRDVGDFVFLRDVTYAYTVLLKKVIGGTLISFIIGTGLFVFFHAFLGRVERSIASQADELSEANKKLLRDIAARKIAEEALALSVADMKKFNKSAVGRELRMIELKRQVNRMAEKAGECPPYIVPHDETALTGGAANEH